METKFRLRRSFDCFFYLLNFFVELCNDFFVELSWYSYKFSFSFGSAFADIDSFLLTESDYNFYQHHYFFLRSLIK